MLNTTNNEALISVYRALRDSASKDLEEAAKLRRVYKGGSKDVIAVLDAELDRAFEAFEVACDDLREVEHGYRQTYPHPRAKCHQRHYRACNGH